MHGLRLINLPLRPLRGFIVDVFKVLGFMSLFSKDLYVTYGYSLRRKVSYNIMEIRMKNRLGNLGSTVCTLDAARRGSEFDSQYKQF